MLAPPKAPALIILSILSCILIFSLMIFNVDEKNYEFGMLRALGCKKSNLLLLIFMEGLVFSIMGFSLGLVAAYCMTTILKYYFKIKCLIFQKYSTL